MKTSKVRSTAVILDINGGVKVSDIFFPAEKNAEDLCVGVNDNTTLK